MDFDEERRKKASFLLFCFSTSSTSLQLLASKKSIHLLLRHTLRLYSLYNRIDKRRAISHIYYQYKKKMPKEKERNYLQVDCRLAFSSVDK